MARKSTASMILISSVLIVFGIGLAVWGYQMSGSLGSQLSSAINGVPTDKVMMLYIGGAVSFIVGLYLSIRK